MEKLAISQPRLIKKIVVHGGETTILGMFKYACGCLVNDKQRSYDTRILPDIRSGWVLRDSCHMLPDKTTQLPPVLQDLERHHTVTVLITVVVESNDMLAHPRDTPVLIPVSFGESICLRLGNRGKHSWRLANLDN